MTAPSGLDFLHAVIRGDHPPAPVQATLGFTLDEAEDGRTVFSLEVAEAHYNPMGMLHGGVATTLLDSAMGCAVQATLPPGMIYTTLEVKVNFVRPATAATGRVIAEGTVVHRGRKVSTAEGRLTTADGALLAHASTTCLIMEMAA